MDLESFVRESAVLANSLNAKDPTAKYYLRCRVGPSSRRAVQVERKLLEPGLSEDDIRRAVEAMADTHGGDDPCFFELLRTGWTSPELSTRVERETDDGGRDQADSADLALAGAMVRTNDTLRLALQAALMTNEKQFQKMLEMVRTDGFRDGVEKTSAELSEVAAKNNQFQQLVEIAGKWANHGRNTPGQALRSVDELAEVLDKWASDSKLSEADRSAALQLAERLAGVAVKGMPTPTPSPSPAAGGGA